MSKSIPPSADQPAAAVAASTTLSSPPTSQTTKYYGTPTLQHAVSLAAAILAPIGILLPPRRMGPRNLLLAAGTFFATSQLTYDYTGQSIYQRFKRRANQLSAEQSQDLPPAALQRQAVMRAERERRRQQREGAAAAGESSSASATDAATDGKLQRLWMGNEKEDWVKERARREQETLESGGGYWDLIMNQIGEVATDLMGKSPKKPEEGTTAVANPGDVKK